VLNEVDKLLAQPVAAAVQVSVVRGAGAGVAEEHVAALDPPGPACSWSWAARSRSGCTGASSLALAAPGQARRSQSCTGLAGHVGR